MSQEQLGKTVGVTFQQIERYANGKNRISGSRIAKMAGALGVEPSYFFDGAPGIGKRNGGAEEADSARRATRQQGLESICADQERHCAAGKRKDFDRRRNREEVLQRLEKVR